MSMRVNPEPAPTAGTGWNIQACGRKVFSAILAFTIGVLVMTAAPATAEQLTPAEARAIAKEATIYGFPLVDSYRVQYSYFVDRGGDQFKAPWNTLVNNARVYTPADTAIQTPNSDTPYSFVGADLRAEPLVHLRAGDRQGSLLLAPVHRHVHVQLRLCRQPGDGQRRRQFPARRAELAWRNAARHQGGDPIGDRICLRPLPDAAFQSGRHRQRQENPGWVQGPAAVAIPRQAGAAAAPAVDFIKPLSPEAERTSPEFFNVLNFVLRVLPAKSGRDGHPGPVRQARDWPARNIRCESAFPGDAQGGPGRHGRRVGGVQGVQGNATRHRQAHERRRVRHARVSQRRLLSPASPPPCSASTATRRTRRSTRSISSTAPRSR